MSRPRRRFSAEQKAQIVRRHLADKEPVSKLAEEFGLQPSQIHSERANRRRIEQLEAKLANKN